MRDVGSWGCLREEGRKGVVCELGERVNGSMERKCIHGAGGGEERVNENNKWGRDNGADLWAYPRWGRGESTPLQPAKGLIRSSLSGDLSPLCLRPQGVGRVRVRE